MAQNRLIVSLSPHDHAKDSVNKIMYGVVIAMIPALLVSVYFFGLDAIRVNLIAIAACIFFEWIIQKLLLKGELTITDGSAIVTGMLLAFNVPSNLPWWIIVIGALVSIGIGKMSFGGLGNNPFNPALVGRVFLLISFPVQMTSWPKVQVLNFAMTDAQTGATPLAIVKEGLKNGESFSSIINNLPTSYSDMFFGQMGGSLGEISAIALIIGGLYMLYRKIITWHIPVSIIATVAIFTGILYGINPDKYADPLFHLLTGGLMLGAIFMATDMVTSPMTAKGMIIYGVGIGIITVLIRVWGAYPEGVSFAILIMNAFTPLINYYVKPKRFGEIVKK
ncbi:MAG: RnfABCDGE type electron transport complex subunit D [Bacteroidales bacterium]|jgi:electron transport complex protein RnfD|nr:RnfABCDGE type electron transport complex subunit D [Bacteroidales bacterium]HOL97404.1 RnfABCDGE type electron transport complex subunit D [Bacteroidales bacterium]HOM37173.1 RnfABCDGE type electron transport complex subunit D [Bacteroidales bacterium]HPD24512.1 RnfABCDGE type electron transport complex subunit D [Bacteroidales bacterium]HRT00118.1 RnfABCDGE type electron transport complex subunit D [Bacteroidales bacterium]